MKTPEQVSLDRIAKAFEDLGKTMARLGRAIEEQNRILKAMIPVNRRDVEVTQTIENNDQTVKEVMDSLSSGQFRDVTHLIGFKD